MHKHILVCLDGSSYAAAAEDLALELVGRLGGVIHAVHVIDSSFLEGAFITDISGAMGFEPFLNVEAQMRATLEEIAGALRQRFAARCREATTECDFQVERTSVVHGILEAAKLADLVVLGQRGINARFHEDLLGPTTEALLRRSPVPLLVVPEAAPFPRRPLAAYDGSSKSVRALHHAAELCRDLALGLTVVTVDDDPERARHRLDEAAGYLAPFGIDTEYRHERGEAVEQVLIGLLGDGGFDLLCLGAHGHNRIVELVVGSTSEFLARRAKVPVLCVTRT
jgi:nucleotide-binding universal stress UspA family protein